MKREWPELTMVLPVADVAAQSVVRVLVAYDGPQLAIRRDCDGVHYLTVASDEDVSTVRWLQAPMHPCEQVGVLQGHLSLRDVFLRKLQVVDRTHDGVVVGAWSVDSKQLTTGGHLPEPGVTLPAVVLDEPQPWDDQNERLAQGPVGQLLRAFEKCQVQRAADLARQRRHNRAMYALLILVLLLSASMLLTYVVRPLVLKPETVGNRLPNSIVVIRRAFEYRICNGLAEEHAEVLIPPRSVF